MLIYLMTRINGVIKIKALVDGQVVKKTILVLDGAEKRDEKECKRKNIA